MLDINKVEVPVMDNRVNLEPNTPKPKGNRIKYLRHKTGMKKREQRKKRISAKKNDVQPNPGKQRLIDDFFQPNTPDSNHKVIAGDGACNTPGGSKDVNEDA